MHEAKRLRHFASDNNSGICPEVWAALQEANAGHVTGYGDDPWTETAKKRIRDLFETDCDVFFVFNGTAANSLALASLCDSYHSVIAFDYSHVETDECNAPGFFAPGVKLQAVKGENGKITPDAIERVAKARRDVHASMPRVVSLDAGDRVGHGVHPRRTDGDYRGRAPYGFAGTHGRCAICERRGRSGRETARNLVGDWRRCVEFWRNEEWHGVRRCGRVL